MHTTKIIASILIILTLVLGTGIVGAISLKNTSKKLDNHITNIESYTTSEDWNMAKENMDTIEKDWSKAEGTWTILLDHTEIDNIDNSLARMKKYVESKDKALTLGELANLRQYVKHIPQKESFNLKNIF